MSSKSDTMTIALFIALATFLIGAVAVTVATQQADAAARVPSCPTGSPTPGQPRGVVGPGCSTVNGDELGP
jgi:hypothetical protein